MPRPALAHRPGTRGPPRGPCCRPLRTRSGQPPATRSARRMPPGQRRGSDRPCHPVPTPSQNPTPPRLGWGGRRRLPSLGLGDEVQSRIRQRGCVVRGSRNMYLFQMLRGEMPLSTLHCTDFSVKQCSCSRTSFERMKLDRFYIQPDKNLFGFITMDMTEATMFWIAAFLNEFCLVPACPV